MKILGLDFGSKTIGVAIHDTTVDFTYPLNTIWRKKDNIIRESLREIEKIINENGIEDIVIGLPLTMSDKEGIRAKITLEFADKVKKRFKEKNVYMQDERLTTYEASSILKERGIKKKDEKKYVDSVAAMVILNDYINNKKGGIDGKK